jgi:hypothetical protein
LTSPIISGTTGDKLAFIDIFSSSENFADIITTSDIDIESSFFTNVGKILKVNGSCSTTVVFNLNTISNVNYYSVDSYNIKKLEAVKNSITNCPQTNYKACISGDICTDNSVYQNISQNTISGTTTATVTSANAFTYGTDTIFTSGILLKFHPILTGITPFTLPYQLQYITKNKITGEPIGILIDNWDLLLTFNFIDTKTLARLLSMANTQITSFFYSIVVNLNKVYPIFQDANANIPYFCTGSCSIGSGTGTISVISGIVVAIIIGIGIIMGICCFVMYAKKKKLITFPKKTKTAHFE